MVLDAEWPPVPRSLTSKPTSPGDFEWSQWGRCDDRDRPVVSPPSTAAGGMFLLFGGLPDGAKAIRPATRTAACDGAMTLNTGQIVAAAK